MTLMGLFERTPPSPKLEERLESLEKDMRLLKLEWLEVLDRVQHLMGRIAKRAALQRTIVKQAEENGGEEPEPAPADVDPISQEILNRRNRALLRR